MGPKFEVNAATGGFAWPATNFGNTGNSIYKRIQVAISDLDPNQQGGGQYFAEGQYIAPDDTAAGNGLNNVSYRPASISGSGSSWSMGLTGSTQRELPAIAAWPAADPAVNLVWADIPGDGRVYLGWKVTSLGGDEWEYEFAVYNMTSDRSIGSFTLPLPLGTVVTSTGFHDVAYHSGEPWGVRAVDREHAARRVELGDRCVRCEPERERDPMGNALQLPAHSSHPGQPGFRQ